MLQSNAHMVMFYNSPFHKLPIHVHFLNMIGDEIPKEDCTKLLEELADKEDEDGFFPYTPFLNKLCGKGK